MHVNSRVQRHPSAIRLSGIGAMAHWYDFLKDPFIAAEFGQSSSGSNDSPGDAAVRAVGIDPLTNKPIIPQYAGTIAQQMQAHGIDPNAPDAMTQLVAALRNEESVFRQRAYDQSQQQQQKEAFPWGKALAWGAVGVIGTIVLVKVM